MSKFKVGDKIIMTAVDSSFYGVGDIGTVHKESESDGQGHYWVMFPHHDFPCCVGYIDQQDSDNRAELYVEKHQYKVGDKVRVLDSLFDGVPVGAIKTIVEVRKGDWDDRNYGVKGIYHNSDGSTYVGSGTLHFKAEQLEAYVEPVAVEEIPAEPRRYKVGDIVQLLKTDWPEEFPVGDLLTVELVFDGITGVSFFSETGEECYFLEHEVQLVVPVEDIQLLDATEGNFELTDDQPIDAPVEIKPELVIFYGGVEVRLDANVAYSRKFADAVLNAIYQ